MSDPVGKVVDHDERGRRFGDVGYISTGSAYAKDRGGQVFGSPVDMFVDLKNVVAPDVVFIRADRVEGMGTTNLQIPPDLVVEVSSPSTRRRDLGAKRELYERFGVGAYWFVDLDADRVEVYVPGESGFGPPVFKYSRDILEPTGLPGLAVPVADIFES